MTTFIIAALTADGFIAKNPQHTPMDWTSKEDKQFFVEMTKKAGVVVMGQNTFKTIGKALPGRLNIVYSTERHEGVQTTQKPPRELFADLEKRGFKEVAICGGQTIYTMFMESGVVDTLYLSIEPVIFGKGMALFNKELDAKLHLKATQKIGNDTILLEYDVVKQYGVGN